MSAYREKRKFVLGPQRFPAVPTKLVGKAIIPGIPDARFRTTEGIEPMVEASLAAIQRERDHLAATGGGESLGERNFLAISGGGDKGAFAAGLLCGWSQSGTRPEFGVVTGISTGALIAPYAFLGAEYDEVMRQIYTTVGPDEIFRSRQLVTALVDDGLKDTAPLSDLIALHVDDQLLQKIAEQWQRGRFLLVATTDLDALHPIIWDMGAIASSDAPMALELFRRVLLASASIPGIFPPVMFDVEVDGKRYQEMHVDGGAIAQVMLVPAELGAVAKARGIAVDRPKRAAYLIRNARLDSDWASVERRTLSIMQRALLSLIQSQGVGDLWQIHSIAQRDGVDFNLAFIAPDFTARPRYEFDTDYMRKLFDYGYRSAETGYDWQSSPPGYR